MRAAVCLAFATYMSAEAHAADLTARINEPPAAPLTTADRPFANFAQRAPFAAAPRADDLPLLGPERPARGGPVSGFSIGPIHADMVTRFSGRTGKTHLVPHYHLDGITVLGGSIGGSIDAHGGMVTLNWHTGP